MKNKIILSEKKKTSTQRRKRFSGLLGMSFMLMLLALFTTQCKEDDFTGEVAGVCPEVVLTSPVNGAINVVTNKIVTATFNETMDPSSINETSFMLKKGGKLVSGAVTYSGMTATFAPTDLLDANMVYSATITRDATDPMGNIMRKDTTWSFNTGAIPAVVLTDPVEGASDVALDKIITADFSTAMNASSIDGGTFVVKQGANFVAGTVSYAGLKAIFTPAANLVANKVYTATITTDAKDVAGNALAKDTTWSFATGVMPIITVTDPLNGAVNVAINRKVTATFSKVMSMSTINMTTFTLKQGTNAVSGLVSYEDMTGTFTPTMNLLPGTEYTATITTGVKDLNNNSIEKDSTWKFTTSVLIIPVLPYVVSTDPTHQDINVPLNKVITATFSKTMDPATINSSTFKLMNGLTPVLGFVTYAGLVATFTPTSQLLPATVYEATVTTGAKDVDGNAVTTNKIWRFNTGGIPVVVMTDPSEGASDVALNKIITADFSTAMNASSINGSSFVLKQGANFVAGTVSYAGLKATFTPATKLVANKVYTATITKDAKDIGGNTLAKDTTWSFATGVMPIITVTDPQDGAINVSINRRVTATFSKVMSMSTINLITFTLKQGTNAVSGLVTYQNMTATFTPNANLMPGVEYTATITTGVKDLNSNSIEKDSTWKFTTSVVIVPVLPYVVSTNPAHQDVNVALNKVITVTFSKTMDPTTINSTTFKLMNGLTPVLGFVTYVGLVGTFTPASQLLPGTVYAATVTAGAKDVDGNAMATNKTWSFTTVMPTAQYTANLSSLPFNGGTTTGGGLFDAGSSVTVEAVSAAGYLFNRWTENGVQISPFANYTFLINGNRNLVANFTVIPPTQYVVSLSSLPLNGGTTTGGGLYNAGSQVIVEATPAAGYSFNKWTENGVQVSPSASYQFVINGNRNLVANFTVVISGPSGVDLGSAGDFAILAGSGVSNTGVTTMITGDVGSFPTATMNGLLSGNVNGILYLSASPVVGQAKAALTNAYNDAQGRSLDAISLPGQLGGLTLAPGLYVNSTTSGISGTGANGILTLDAGGNPNAVWIFKMGSTFITSAGTSVVLAGGAQAKNIYWSVGSSATLGTNSIFFGNILAEASITLTTGATLTGRALTRTGAVTLDTNTVTKP